MPPFVAINQEDELERGSTGGSQKSTFLPAEYSSICIRLKEGQLTEDLALAALMNLIEEHQEPRDVMLGVYGLALDIASSYNAHTYSALAKKSIDFDSNAYAFRVHLRNSFADDLQHKIWASAWVIQHKNAKPVDYAMYFALLRDTGQAYAEIAAPPYFQKAVFKLLDEQPFANFPLIPCHYEPYVLHLKASNWQELMTKTLDTLEKAVDEVFIRPIEIVVYESLTQDTSSSQQHRVSKRQKIDSTADPLEKILQKEVIEHVDAIIKHELIDVKEASFVVPQRFDSVIELFRWLLHGIVKGKFELKSSQITRLQTWFSRLDGSVLDPEIYLEMLYYFCERLPFKHTEFEFLKIHEHISPKFRRISGLHAEHDEDLEEAEKIFAELRLEKDLHRVKVKQAIRDGRVLDFKIHVDPELAFDYYIAVGNHQAAYQTFYASPFAFSAERLAKIHMNKDQAAFMAGWTFRHLNKDRACMLNAVSQTDLVDSRAVLDLVEPDERLLHHIIDNSTDKQLQFECLLAILGIAPKDATIHLKQKEKFSLTDWSLAASLAMELTSEMSLWEKLTSLFTPTKILCLNRERLKDFLRAPVLSPLPRLYPLDHSEELYTKALVLHVRLQIENTDVIKRKPFLPGRNTDHPIRVLRRSLKLCGFSKDSLKLLALLYKEHAARLLLLEYPQQVKNRGLILRLLRKAFKCYQLAMAFDETLLCLRWMIELGVTELNTSKSRKLLPEKATSVSTKSLFLFTVRQQSSSPSTLTLLTLAKFTKSVDEDLRVQFLVAAYGRSQYESKAMNYYATYKLAKYAILNQRHDLLHLLDPEMEDSLEFMEGQSQTHPTQHLHLHFLAQRSSSIETHWAKLFPVLLKPKTPTWHHIYANEQDRPGKHLHHLSKYLSSLLKWLSERPTEQSLDPLMIVVDRLRACGYGFPRWREVSQKALDLYTKLTGTPHEGIRRGKSVTGHLRSIRELYDLLQNK